MATFDRSCATTAAMLQKPGPLYELVINELRWIADVLVELNSLGFLTFVSQPGSERRNYPVYDSLYHRDGKLDSHIIHHNGVRRQRAYIRGHMRRAMASFVINKLKHHRNLFMRSEDHSDNVDLDIKIGSVIFVDEEPILKVFPERCDDTTIDFDGSFNLSLPLRGPYAKFYPNNVVDSDITEFEIMDVNWNDNTCLWTTLLEAIRAFKN